MLNLSRSNVTHPSEFPADDLRKVDRSFRCTICKDIYDAPVILHCGHTFCSLCIRSSLPHKPECPTCRVPAKESHLVRNVMFDEAVMAWTTARTSVLNNAVAASRPASDQVSLEKKRGFPEDFTIQDGNSVAHDERPRKAQKRVNTTDIVSTSETFVEESSTFSETNPPVSCPICSNQVRLNFVDAHIESACKSGIVADGISKPASKTAWASIFKNKGPSQEDAQIPMKRLAKVSYGTLNLSGLRKLLSEKGLPTTGDKDELIARHERWIAIFNANLDRANPKTIGELKIQLKEAEADVNRPPPLDIGDETEWTKRNHAQFKSLIEAARQKKKARLEASTSRCEEASESGQTRQDVIFID